MPRPWPRRCRRTARSRGVRCRPGGRGPRGGRGSRNGRRGRSGRSRRDRAQVTRGGGTFEKGGVRHEVSLRREPGRGFGVCCDAASERAGDSASSSRDRRGVRILEGSGQRYRSCARIERVAVFSDGFVSATHSTTHDDAAGHHHAGSPVRLQGGQRACVVSHVAIMTDCVENRQIARMPQPRRDGMLQIAQSQLAPAPTFPTPTTERICCHFQQKACAPRRDALTIAIEALRGSASIIRTAGVRTTTTERTWSRSTRWHRPPASRSARCRTR